MTAFIIGSLIAFGITLSGEARAQENSEKLPVFRKGNKSSLNQNSAPISVALTPVVTTGISEDISQNIGISIRSHLREIENIRLVGEEKIESILGKVSVEIGYACRDFACALEVGRLAEAQRVLLAKAWMEDSTWTLELKMVDAPTGSIIKRETDVYDGGEIGFLSELVPKLVSQVAQPKEKKKRDTSKPFVKVVRKEKGEVVDTNAPVAEERKSGGLGKWVWYTGGSVVAAGVATALVILNPFEEKGERIDMSREVNIE